MRLEIKVEGDHLATLHLRSLAERADNLQPLFQLMRPALEDSEKEKFRTGWSKSTLRSYGFHTPTRGKRKGQRTIRELRDVKRYTLVDTGRLRESLTLASPENVFHAGRYDLEFGTSVFYARFLKKRGFNLIPVNKRLRERLSGITRDYLLEEYE